MAIHLAHVRQLGDGSLDGHVLDQHLEAVAQRAAEFADAFGAGDWAWLAGSWHDLGKYRASFQCYLRRETGFADGAFQDAPLDRTEHAVVGAVHAVHAFPRSAGRVLAYLIAGHHTGLPDWYTDEAGDASLRHRLADGEALYQEIRPGEAVSGILNASLPSSRPPAHEAVALWIRLLFSCLVDADFLDTERFLQPDRAELRCGYSTLRELKPAFDEHMRRLEAEAREEHSGSKVNRLRSEVLEACRQRAHLPPGLFSLTVPTGGGKTLSSMAFALEHALAHGKRRIIYVIPYTSIIEQVADVFRGIFGDAVIEHHSNLDYPGESEHGVGEAYLRGRLAAENWDAPVIVTTAVQFFESLFATRTSRVRKLHNVVDSVVVLDEVQLLPPDFLAPILQALEQLVSHFRVTILLMTATQPALEDREEGDFHFRGLKGVREIADEGQRLYTELRRVTVELPVDLRAPQSWEEIATELAREPSVLCIVDTRRDCRTLWRLLTQYDPNAIHLSALMCGAHRAKVIADIRERLRRKIPTRVVSTQLIEAGVDVDFPVVYRALAGLDSVAQAAGRCNREGRLRNGCGELVPGRVVIFVPPTPAPQGHLRMAQDCGRQLLAERVEDPLAPARFARFFKELYWKYGPNLDRHRILEDLKTRPELDFRFRTAAGKFRIIDDSEHAPVIVRYGEDADALIAKLRYAGPSRDLLRRLQRRMVTISRWNLARLVQAGVVAEPHPGLFVQEDSTAYHPDEGFQVELDEVRDASTLTI